MGGKRRASGRRCSAGVERGRPMGRPMLLAWRHCPHLRSTSLVGRSLRQGIAVAHCGLARRTKFSVRRRTGCHCWRPGGPPKSQAPIGLGLRQSASVRVVRRGFLEVPTQEYAQGPRAARRGCQNASDTSLGLFCLLSLTPSSLVGLLRCFGPQTNNRSSACMACNTAGPA